MKILRIVVTLALGAYLIAMALQFTGVCMMLVRDRMSPFSPQAPAAFFTNLIVCLVSGLAIWLLWRRGGRESKASH